jgi:quaternary ammonium compound-resistance protein SugE
MAAARHRRHSRNRIRAQHEGVGGFTRLTPSLLTVAAGLSSVVLLSLALRTLPVGSGYAVWTGIGAAGAAILGIVLMGESAAPMRLLCIGLILAGVIGLKLVPSH